MSSYPVTYRDAEGRTKVAQLEQSSSRNVPARHTASPLTAPSRQSSNDDSQRRQSPSTPKRPSAPADGWGNPHSYPDSNRTMQPGLKPNTFGPPTKQALTTFGRRGLRVAPKVASRFIPGIGWIMTLWDMLTFFRIVGGAKQNLYGWNSLGNCDRVGGQEDWNLAGCGAPQYDTPRSKNNSSTIWYDNRYLGHYGTPLRYHYEIKPGWARVNNPGVPAKGHKTPPIAPDWTPPRSYIPAVAPESVPINHPVPTPQPVPYEAIPEYHRQRKTPHDQSTASYDLSPGKKKPPQINYRPNPAGDKEKKSKVRQATAVAIKEVLSVTELIDFAEALHDGTFVVIGMNKDGTPKIFHIKGALPEHLKAPKGSNPAEKAEALWKNWTELDPNQALLNLAANHHLDLAVGIPSGNWSQFAVDNGFTSTKFPQAPSL